MNPLRHPIRGDALTPLEQLLWRFRMVAHEAQTMLRGFNHYPDSAEAINSELWFSLSNQALLIVAKFLEVWRASNALALAEARIICMRKALKPLVDRILVWKGLQDMRNTALAHAYLDDDGNIVTPWKLIEEETAPTFHAESILLLHLVHFAVMVVLTVFNAEYMPIDSLAGPGKTHSPSKGPGIEKGTEIQPELKRIAALVDPLLRRECNVTVGGPFASAFQQALHPRAA